MKKYKAVVLAAGQGTRMKSNKLKVLHEAAGKPMVCWTLDALKEAGIDDITVICGNGMEELKARLKDSVTYAEQTQRLGTAHAVMAAKDMLGKGEDYVVIMAGDMPLYKSETIKNVCQMASEGDYGCVILTAKYDDPTGYGRIIRSESGDVLKIVEEANCTEEQKKIKEANSFLYCVKSELLLKCFADFKPNPPKGEYYLTDAVELINGYGEKVGAYVAGDTEECLGVNDRVQLAQVSKILRKRILEEHMRNGVTVIDPDNTYIDSYSKIGKDTVIYPGVILENSVVGENVTLYQGSRINNSQIGDGTTVQNSVMLDSCVGKNTTVGPYAYLRPGTVVGDKCRVGDFVEIKNSQVDDGAKISHLTYVGDGHIGKRVNVGCGVVFVNYDGKKKYKIDVGDDVFIGCNTNLISPVNVGDGAYIAAGSTVTEDLPEKSFCIARSRQTVKTDWKDKRDE